MNKIAFGLLVCSLVLASGCCGRKACRVETPTPEVPVVEAPIQEKEEIEITVIEHTENAAIERESGPVQPGIEFSDSDLK